MTDTTPAVTVKGGVVAMSVSRQHCQLTIDAYGGMSIRNLSPHNVTWVDGLPIEETVIALGQRIELGYEHVPFDWSLVKTVQDRLPASSTRPNPRPNPGPNPGPTPGPKPGQKEYDISHLEMVWNAYHANKEALARKQAMVNVFRGGIPMLTLGGAAVGFVLGRDNEAIQGAMPLIYTVAVVLSAVFLVIGFRYAKEMPQKREALNKKFLHDYTCPGEGCHYFFGFQPYDVIRVNVDVCPKCKARLKKKS